MRVPLKVALTLMCCLVPAAFALAAPKLDKETCEQLKGEQTKFMESGIVEDLQKGPAWGKTNLTAERLREIEHFILLDEQLKFGCRQVTLTADVLRAGEAATKIEANPNPADPSAAAVEKPSGGTGNAAAPGLPGQPVQDEPVQQKPAKPKRDKPATAPAKPKAADAYQPEHSGAQGTP